MIEIITDQILSQKEEEEIIASATEATIWTVQNGLNGTYSLFEKWERILHVLGW